MELQTLNEIELEVKRFMKRLDAVKERIKKEKIHDYPTYNTFENGALKRAALDLKMELTKITK